ncbi:MAG: NRAMP family divalent metal transporter [Bacillota bacterium]
MSIAIIVTAAAMHGSVEVKSAADMAKQLEPLLGPWAKWFFALGLFAAGATSAMTAPLAAAYAVTGVLGWQPDMRSFRFRAIWLIVLIVGAFVALTGANPVQVIVFAQAINGVLLPISAIYLIIVMNRERLMKEFTNTPVQNVLGWIVTGITIVLGLRLILRAFGIIK